MSDLGSRQRVTLEQQRGFRFRVKFGESGIPALLTDEPPPLGDGVGPNPSMLLAAAVGNCLASSLLYCMDKARLQHDGMEVEVETITNRNEVGRLRIEQINARLIPAVSPEVQARMGRCLDLFESFCLVTESVRRGIDVRVEVAPATVPTLGVHGAAHDHTGGGSAPDRKSSATERLEPPSRQTEGGDIAAGRRTPNGRA